MTNLLIAAMIGCIVVGSVLLCFAVDFIDMPDGETEVVAEWLQAWFGVALLMAAAFIAAARWPV